MSTTEMEKESVSLLQAIPGPHPAGVLRTTRFAPSENRSLRPIRPTHKGIP
ncbi:hypothetical protein Nhal_2542 [Nitrosococcus halophilus Nc 4]|uniref:Uncharacterized protein n=1 Tax=Nitrosococcus halophilus (strain Nc4) TaxID=472759 RepID=D5BWG5_NITHN|nr:hypothetical protein [Nitrosococcus halophilus]ADE15622.1 hypothetical protein Nhal_2542 [Nitrosococcus halophilus Nc 4]